MLLRGKSRDKSVFTEDELKLFRKFKEPYDIQLFLNEIPYDASPGTSSSKVVLREKRANCFEGALFGAAALRMLGHKPLIVDMIAVNDDDHVMAIFKRDGNYGAVAKSNTTVLQYREPVYHTLRELVMSYFDFYFNISGEKSLRSYSNPVNLSKFDKQNWMTTEENLDFIGDYLNEIKHNKILSTKQVRKLNLADDDLVKLCFEGAVKDGIYRPKKRKCLNLTNLKP